MAWSALGQMAEKRVERALASPNLPRSIVRDELKRVGKLSRQNPTERGRSVRADLGQHLVKEPTETDGIGRYSCDTSRMP